MGNSGTSATVLKRTWALTRPMHGLPNDIVFAGTGNDMVRGYDRKGRSQGEFAAREGASAPCTEMIDHFCDIGGLRNARAANGQESSLPSRGKFNDIRHGDTVERSGRLTTLRQIQPKALPLAIAATYQRGCAA